MMPNEFLEIFHTSEHRHRIMEFVILSTIKMKLSRQIAYRSIATVQSAMLFIIYILRSIRMIAENFVLKFQIHSFRFSLHIKSLCSEKNSAMDIKWELEE